MASAAGSGGRWRATPFGLLGDERLAQRVGAGDERAFVVVYERYHQILYRYCRSILHNDVDAQDALQSTFAAAFAALRAGQRDAPMRPWLFRIAHNESISMLRRSRPGVELSKASVTAATSTEEQVAERAELSVLLRDLHQLTDRQRSALVLRELSGLSHQEIAIALGTSVGAAKQTIFEARQSLFEFAQGRAMACAEIRRTISDADGRTLRSRRVRAHLRECSGCAGFATAIPARSGELRALSPALPGAAAVGLFARLAVPAAGRGGGAGLARLAAGAAAKTASASAGFGANALAGVAVVATATAGVTVGVGRMVHAMPHRDAVRTGPHTAALAGAPSKAGVASRLLGAGAASGVRSDGALARAASGAGAAAPQHAVHASGLVGASRSGRAITGRPGWAQGSGRADPSRQGAGALGGTAYPSGAAWTGTPARAGWNESWPDGSSTQGKAANAGSTQAGSAASGWHVGTSPRQGSGKPFRGTSRRHGSTGSGTSAQNGASASAQSGTSASAQSGASASAQSGTGRSKNASPVGLTVNSPVPTSVSSTVGKAEKTVGGVSSTVGGATSTVGNATSTVAGPLPVTSGASPAPALPALTLLGSLTARSHRDRVSS
jgi:RNA polymerase sigma factor (sigma-70 family)